MEGTYPKKNLNSIVAFVIAFLIVASSRLVAIVNEVASNFVILLMLSILFLLLVGVFHKEEEAGFFLTGGWRTIFMVIMFVGIVLIFLNALGWLEDTWKFVGITGPSEAIGVAVLLLVFILFIMFIVRDPKKTENKA